MSSINIKAAPAAVAPPVPVGVVHFIGRETGVGWGMALEFEPLDVDALLTGRNDGDKLCLFSAPLPAPAGVAPEGWKLVPIEPTAEMIEAVDRIRHGRVLSHTLIYAAIAAAPSAEAAPSVTKATGSAT